jgi:hypothetical protein
MGCMAYCELYETDRAFCEHGQGDRREAATATVGSLLISPKGTAHFGGYPHKGDDQDYERWAELKVPRAWERLGNGEHLQATGGKRPSLVARARCQDCVSHGPW